MKRMKRLTALYFLSSWWIC